MLRSIATVSLSGTLNEKFRACASAGFDAIEIFENDLVCSTESPETLRQMADDLGLKIALYQPFRDFEGVSAERLQQNLERARRKFDVMHRLGTDRILVCSNVAPDVVRDDSLTVDQLGVLAELAREHEVLVGFEALAWGAHINSYRHAWKLVNRVDHQHLGLVLDSFHTLSIGDDLSMLASIPSIRIVFVQLADAPRLAMNVLEWSRRFRCFPGHGSFDLAAFVSPILVNGYDGPLSLEIFNDGYRAAPTRPNAADGFRSLLWVEAQARLRGGLHAVENAETTQIPLDAGSVSKSFSPPAAPVHFGFEFLEFAVDDFTRTRLAEWFAKFGFVRTGKHRSKRVSLFQHGQINLILNAEPNSFADTFYVEHGLSVCATALRVDRADLAMRRAVQLRYQPFSGSVGPNERVIPAIKTPDGSLLYFVEEGENASTIYESDFIPEDTATSADCSLLGIDHICVAIPPRLIDSWTFFCKAALGLQAEHQFALADPHGLIQSRGLRSEDGRLRITLNTSSDEHTGVSRSISAYKGAGLQHLSFGSNDIFSTVIAMKSQGIPLLRIPRNYYEDLAGKYQLDQESIDAMEAHDILYDRDSNGGEFFHAYTQHVGSRFFFEINERRGGYDGYGAANTPVRIAAHARCAQQ